MPVSNSIITPQSPKTFLALTTAALVAPYSAAAVNSVVLLPAQATALRGTRLTAIALNTNTALNLQLYLSKDGGVTNRLLKTMLMAANTASATTAQPLIDFGYSDANPLMLQVGDILKVAQSVALADGISWALETGDYQ